MKKLISFIAVLTVIVSATGCAHKNKPSIQINLDSVTSVDFKKTVFSTENPSSRTYLEKKVTEKEDIKKIVDWANGLKLSKHQAIEIQIMDVEYVIELNGVKKHKLIFVGNYVVFDNTAYTYDNVYDVENVKEKYNFLNYDEVKTELGLM